MGLFSKSSCCICGKSVGMLAYTFKDQNCLCDACRKRIPDFYGDYPWQCWDINEYRKYLGMKAKAEENRKIFKITDSFGWLKIDGEHGLFCIFPDKKATLADPRVEIFSFDNLCNHEFVLESTETKGLLGPDRYDVDIYLSFGLTQPDLVASPFVHTIHVYVKKGEMVADKNGRKEWEEFVGIQLLLFWCILKFHPEYQGGMGKLQVPMEIEKAMNLFLLDSLDSETEANLKARRNALMKIFHPDEGGGQMEEYAKKINDAYDTIRQALSGVEQ